MKTMKKLWARFRSGVRSEKGENTITMIIMFPLLWAIIMTVIDFGVFFNNRSALMQDLRDGARTVSILGGTSNDLSTAYGVSATGSGATCKATGGTVTDIIDSAYTTDQVTRAVAKKICDNTTYTQMSIYGLKCGPTATSKVGEATWCQANYIYAGMPGSAFTWFGGGNDAGITSQGTDTISVNHGTTNSDGTPTTGWNAGTIRMSAQSETITQ